MEIQFTALHFLCSCLERLCPEGVAAGLTEGQLLNSLMVQKMDSSPCLPVTSYVTLDKLCSLNFPVSHWVNDDSYCRLLHVTYWDTVPPSRFWWPFLVDPQ